MTTVYTPVHDPNGNLIGSAKLDVEESAMTVRLDPVNMEGLAELARLGMIRAVVLSVSYVPAERA